MSINPQQIKSLDVEPGKKFSTFPDGNGLYLYVHSKNKKWWRFRCRYDGKQVLIALGTWPEVSLKAAREAAEELYRLRKHGKNPSEYLKEKRKAEEREKNSSFEAVTREWQATQKADVTQKSKYRILYGFEKYVFPFIGNIKVSEVTAPQLLEIARRMEASGLTETVHRVMGYCSNVFLYAIAGGRAQADPTTAVKKQLKPLPSEAKHMAATIDPVAVGNLLRMADGYTGSFVVQTALKLAPLVFVRPGELRKALWADIDFSLKEWRFVASKTRQAHIVPLSNQAINLLKELQPATFDSPFIFPNPTAKNREMSNNAILAAYRRMGIEKNEHCGHGWRATARTLLDEELRYPLKMIELQLAHSVKDVHGRAYNRTTFLEDRHKMMQVWADYLDELKNSPCPDIKALREKFRY